MTRTTAIDFEEYQVANWAPVGQFIRQTGQDLKRIVERVSAPALVAFTLAAGSVYAAPSPAAAKSEWGALSNASPDAKHTEMPAKSFSAFLAKLTAAPEIADRSTTPDPDPFF